jgi:two-component system nitrogen regulation sensor histidine kinase NtrY
MATKKYTIKSLLKTQTKRKRELIIILAVLLSIIVLTLLQASITASERQLPTTKNILIYGLINLNITLLLLLIFLVVRNIVKLLFERRRGILGARLRTRLIVAFVGLSIVPTVLLFWVSAEFITATIESWFSSQVEYSLAKSLEVAQVYYKNSSDNSIYYAKQISNAITENKLLNEANLKELKEFIKQKQEEYNLGVVEVFSSTLEELVKAMNPNVPVQEFIGSESELVQKGLEGREITKIQPAGKGPAGKGDIIRGVVPIYSTFKKGDVVGTLVVNYYVPQSLVSKMATISSAFKEYKQQELLKNPIKTANLMILAIVTLLIIFSATWFGFYLSKSLTDPIQMLAEGTDRIAQGDLDFTIETAADDEMGSLVSSFNKMTADLKTSKIKIEQASNDLYETNLELERRRRYMETILKNVTAGVISIDEEGKVTTINKSAETLLKVNSDQSLFKAYDEVFATSEMDVIRELIKEMISSGRGVFERQIRVSDPENITELLASGTMLKDDEENYLGMVLVFENITHLQKAQRAAAWREVARRIAHEIKNPLTPIQLSAQRLRKKYKDAFTDDGTVFDECTKIILNQTDEIKNLVNEFSNFARMPATNPHPNDLMQVINESVALLKGAHKNITFSVQEEQKLPIFDLDKDQMKRAIINILDNAVDAIEKKGSITVTASYDKSFQIAKIEIADSGCGIPQEQKKKLFEPYFSTKKSGTGLGLPIVNTIISDHNGYIRVRDNQPKGTKFIIELPVKV